MDIILAKDAEVKKIYSSKSMKYKLRIKSINHQGNSEGDVISVTVVNLSSPIAREINISPDTQLLPYDDIEQEIIKEIQVLTTDISLDVSVDEEEDLDEEDLDEEDMEENEVTEINTNENISLNKSNQINQQKEEVIKMVKKTATEKASVKSVPVGASTEKVKVEKVKVVKEKKVTRASIIDIELAKIGKNDIPDFEAITKLAIKAGVAREEEYINVIGQAKVRYKWYKDGTKVNPAVAK